MFKKNKKPIIIENDDLLDLEYAYIKDNLGDIQDKKLDKRLSYLKKTQLLKDLFEKKLTSRKNIQYIFKNISLQYGEINDYIDYLIITKNNIYAVNINNTNSHDKILKIIGFTGKSIDKIIFENKFNYFYHEINILKDSDINNIINDIKTNKKTKLFSKEIRKITKRIPFFIVKTPLYLDILYKDYFDEKGNIIKNKKNNMHD